MQRCLRLSVDMAPVRSSDRGERDRAARVALTIQIVGKALAPPDSADDHTSPLRAHAGGKRASTKQSRADRLSTSGETGERATPEAADQHDRTSAVDDHRHYGYLRRKTGVGAEDIVFVELARGPPARPRRDDGSRRPGRPRSSPRLEDP